MTDGGARPTEAAAQARHPWAAVVLVMLGTFMVILDTTIVNVALPQIAVDLEAESGIEWVVTGYLLAMGVAQSATGWVGARFGDRTAFLGSLGLFALFSALAASAPNLPLLILARSVQGVFGGLAVPLSASILFAMFPPDKRGAAIGMSATVVMVAPGLGPVLSGYVVTNFSWRWLLLVNVPFGLVGVLLGLRLVPEGEGPRERRFDLTGLVLVAGGLVGLLIGISRGNDWGWTSGRFLATALVSATLLLAYRRHARRVANPLIEPEIFADPVFRLTIFITWAVATAQFARLVFIPLELQVVQGMTAFKAGAIVGSAAIGSAITMPVAGRLTDRFGGRTPVATGAAVLALAMWMLSTLGTGTATWLIVAAVGLTGIGVVLVTMPTTVTGLNWLSYRLGDWVVSEAAAVRNLHRQVAGAVATAGLAVIVISSGGTLAAGDHSADLIASSEAGYGRVYLVALVGTLIAIALALRLPKSPPPEKPEATSTVDVDEVASTDRGTT